MESSNGQISNVEAQKQHLVNQSVLLSAQKDTILPQQKSSLNSQKSNIKVTKDSNSAQRAFYIEQKNNLVGKKDYYLLQFEKMMKEYLNLDGQLKQMKRQMPVNFLTNGQIIKGYNESGNLVTVYDHYENYAAIEYENYYLNYFSGVRIARVYDNNGKTVTFTYTPKNKLSAITDTRGRKVIYGYDTTGEKLEKIKYDTGKEVNISYFNDNIASVEEMADALKTTLSYEGNKLRYIYNYSTINDIPKTNTSAVTKLLSLITISYFQATNTDMNYTLVTEDTNKEKYIFDSERNCTAYYLEENGVVTTAEQYEYVPYWKGTTAQDDPKSIVTQQRRTRFIKQR